MLGDFLIGTLLSILVGALIGTQREIKQQKEKQIDFAGFRTFTFISLLGFLIGHLSFNIFNSNLLVIIGVFGVFILVNIAYFATTKVFPKKISSITEISVLISFILGIFISLGLFQESVMLSIIITTILFLGNHLHKFAKNLKNPEIFATIKFAIISAVILPLLPDKDYTPLSLPFIGQFFQSQTLISQEILVQLDVFNFYYIWLMVVFISAISYIGYILMRTVGAEKGTLITGILGGLASSTALTSSFSIESKKLKYLSIPLAVGTIIACSTMFFRIIFEVAVINPTLLSNIFFSLLIMGLVGFGFAYKLFKNSKLDHVKKLDLVSPFSLIPAFKFSILFVVVILISKFFSIIFGESGIYLVSFISGFADVDAITITLANLALNNGISNFSASIGILLAAFSNTLFKAGIAYYLGSNKYFKEILVVFSIILITGFLVLILF